jgi:hypothetical protein
VNNDDDFSKDKRQVNLLGLNFFFYFCLNMSELKSFVLISQNGKSKYSKTKE